MFGTANRLLRVATSSPTRSDARGDGGLVSLAFAGAVLAEIALCGIIIARVTYTEIDWVAYMQEVKGFLDGERNYLNLRGDTGPLVYPAGFVYAYSLLYWMTDRGEDIFTAQYIFMGVYVSLMVMVLSIYRRAGSGAMPLWSILLVCTSRRVHSIFVLRLFNDGVAMWLLYGAVYLFLLNRWRLGCVSYSMAVGVKMNILLFAPGLLLLLVQANGVGGAAVCLSICAGVQLLLGAPFLLHHPVAYLSRSFELGRVFKFEWTVNFKFLTEEAFVSPGLSIALLALTLAALALFASKWLRSAREVKAFSASDLRAGEGGGGATGGAVNARLHPEYVVKTLFVSNFIGIVFCRSLHYQFYSWYYHTLPFLLWQTGIPVALRLVVLCGVEFGFNVFPATTLSSGVLQVCHLAILAGLWVSPVVVKRKAATLAPAKRR
ncbi:unnamed protein product [Ectocarpus sp. 13 AM-2016]